MLIAGCVKVIEGEGMPLPKMPFQKGQLIVQFDVQFPENQFCDEVGLKALEVLLPPRPAFRMPIGDDVEEVNLYDLSPGDTGGSRSEAYEEEEEMGRPGAMRCAHQ